MNFPPAQEAADDLTPVGDLIDQANTRAARDAALAEAACRAKAAAIPPGAPGDCDLCGEWSQRLVAGACAPCRDKYKLP